MIKEEIKKEDIVTKEDLKKNIESTLTEIKNLMNITIEDKSVERYFVSQLDELGILINHDTVRNIVVIVKMFLDSKNKIDSLTNELMTYIEQGILWEKIDTINKESEKTRDAVNKVVENVGTVIESKLNAIEEN